MTAELWDDLDFINQCLKNGEPPARPSSTYTPVNRCRWCCHNEHGLPCTGPCRCEGSWTSRDDSWRPSDTDSTSAAGRVRSLSQTTGVDGWAASEAVTVSFNPLHQARAARIHRWLLGGK